MQAEYYTDKSIAVFGDTKPWATNLRAMGGKFNGNLRGRPGWIFQKAKEGELMQFIAQANQGLVQAVAPVQTAYPVATPQMVPMGHMQPAMTPQAAMAQLAHAQPMTNTFNQVQPIPSPFPQVQTQQVPIPVPSPRVAMPHIQPIVTTPVAVPRPLTPTPVALQQQQPVNVAFPNMFTAADGLSYQIILYTAPVPSVGQRVTVNVGEAALEYSVSAINSEHAPIDDILIRQVLPEDTDPDTVPAVSRVIIMKGKWQIFCMQDEHSLTFYPLNQ